MPRFSDFLSTAIDGEGVDQWQGEAIPVDFLKVSSYSLWKLAHGSVDPGSGPVRL